MRTQGYRSVKDEDNVGTGRTGTPEGGRYTGRLLIGKGCLGLAPVVAGLRLIGEDLIESVGLLNQDVALHHGLMQQNSLQPH